MTRLNNSPLSSQAYNLLLEEILKGTRPAGERISEESIAQEFGISRTPAREALMRLSADGLIERTARKGCRIAQVDRDKQRDLFQCRALLEALALDLGFHTISQDRLKALEGSLKDAIRQNDAAASLAADDLLHALILESCPNHSLVDIIHRLQQQCQAFRALRSVSTPVEAITRERLNIVKAIMKGDAAKAKDLLTKHILQGVPDS
jgi:DNA-binding GntR family transcriptional regulator